MSNQKIKIKKMRFPWSKNREKKPETPIGFVDNVKNRRIGLIFLFVYSDGKYNICKQSEANVIFEVTEVFNDKTLSKIQINTVIFNKENRFNGMNQFNVWLPSSQVYWLEPSTPVARDNKLDELLS